jgi:hypothetical protein
METSKLRKKPHKKPQNISKEFGSCGSLFSVTTRTGMPEYGRFKWTAQGLKSWMLLNLRYEPGQRLQPAIQRQGRVRHNSERAWDIRIWRFEGQFNQQQNFDTIQSVLYSSDDHLGQSTLVRAVCKGFSYVSKLSIFIRRV